MLANVELDFNYDDGDADDCNGINYDFKGGCDNLESGSQRMKKQMTIMFQRCVEFLLFLELILRPIVSSGLSFSGDGDPHCLLLDLNSRVILRNPV